MYGVKVFLLSMLRRWIFFLAANDEGKYFFIEPFIKRYCLASISFRIAYTSEYIIRKLLLQWKAKLLN